MLACLLYFPSYTRKFISPTTIMTATAMGGEVAFAFCFRLDSDNDRFSLSTSSLPQLLCFTML